MEHLAGFILASGSAARFEILSKLGYPIKKVAPQDVDETPLKGELPRSYVRRIVCDKMRAASEAYPEDVILVADTIVMLGRRILQKAKDAEEQTQFMRWMSGRRHQVLTCVCLYNPKKQNPFSERLVSTLVQMKKLTDAEIEAYVTSGVWKKCAGYRFNWLFQSFVKRMDGSISCIAGLPVFETKNLLESAGFCVSSSGQQEKA